MLQYVDSCIDKVNSNRLDGPFDLLELCYALSQLGTDKTPGVDGLSKEFIMKFWDVIYDLVL